MAPIKSWSKLQKEPAASTPEAEFAALARAVQVTAYPLVILMNEVLEDDNVMLEVLTDNKAAEAVAKSGSSKKLKYMQKHRRVRTAFVKHFLENRNQDPNQVVRRIESEKNLADPFTKPLGQQKHYEHIVNSGMMDRAVFDGR